MVAPGDTVLQAGSCLCWQRGGRAGPCPLSLLGQCDPEWAGLGSSGCFGALAGAGPPKLWKCWMWNVGAKGICCVVDPICNNSFFHLSGNIPGQAGQALEHPGRVEGVPAHGRGGTALRSLQPNPFQDSMGRSQAVGLECCPRMPQPL